MRALTKRDLYWVLQRLPQPVVEAMRGSNGRLFLAGGFVRACVAKARELWLAGKLGALLFEVDPELDPEHAYHLPSDADTALPKANDQPQEERFD
jgi:hypothetical protein